MASMIETKQITLRVDAQQYEEIIDALNHIILLDDGQDDGGLLSEGDEYLINLVRSLEDQRDRQ